MTDRKRGLPRLSWEDVWAKRLERHGLLDPLQDVQPADIVRVICGAHAQVMSAAELSIGLRIAGITRRDLRDALWNQRSLVKTYGPRGTVHLLPAQDLPIWTGALSATPSGQIRLAMDDLLTLDQAEALIEAIAVILAETELTTDELTEALVEQVGSWAGDPVMPAFQQMWPRWRMVQAHAGMRGALCFGPNRGRKVTYTNPQRWLPGFKPADGHKALAEILKRYLYAYGPASSQHFAQWLAVPPRWAAELFDSLASDLQQVEVEGETAWVPVGDTTPPGIPPKGVRLLPYFDAYVVGCHPRGKLFPGPATDRGLAGGQAGNFPVMMINGVVAGVWHQRRSGRKIEITVEPLVDLTAAQLQELNDQVERIGEILEGKSQLALGKVTTGPHA